MTHYNLALVGFGNVGQAFASLLLRKRTLLQEQYGLTFAVTGIKAGRRGGAIDPRGLDLEAVLAEVQNGGGLARFSASPCPADSREFVRNVPADVLFENTPTEHTTGQPATDHLRLALERGMHAITANKGPVVHAHAELCALAASKGRRFLFESAVMDGAPIFSLFRGPLPAADLIGIRGIFNSCTNFILGLMEQGQDFEEAVEQAQAIGIAETDPSADIDGWDAAIKVAALSTVLMGHPLKPQQVERAGIRQITPQQMAEARAAGERWKLVCSIERLPGGVAARVAPQRVKPNSPLYCIEGTSSYAEFQLDTLPGLGIVENNPGPDTTAYGLLADFLNAARGM